MSKNLRDKVSSWIMIENPLREKYRKQIYWYEEKLQRRLKKFFRKKYTNPDFFEEEALKFLDMYWINLYTKKEVREWKEKMKELLTKAKENFDIIIENSDETVVDQEKLRQELSWEWIRDLEELFKWTYEEQPKTISIFWINKLFTLHLNQNKNIYITNDEYQELVWTYSLFFQSYKNSTDWKYIEKTLKILLEEMIICANLFWLDKWEFLKDCWIDINTIHDPSILKKLHWTWKKQYEYKRFIEKEIMDSKSDKVKTEIVMKILLFKNNLRSFSLMLYNKMHWMMQNTHIKLLITEKFENWDFENLFVFELIKWIKWYREKLFNWHWHKTKLMSYIDRILRNLAWTVNQKIVANQELYWLYAQQKDWDEWDQIVDYLWWYDTINEDEIYFDFDKWWFMIRYLDWNDTELLTEFNKSFHYYKFDDLNISLILNLQWYYFFEKAQKNYDLYWKIINSYFDLIILLKKYWKLSYQEMKKLVWNNTSLKFWVLWMNWENYNKLIVYEFSTVQIHELLIEKWCKKEDIRKFMTIYNHNLLKLINLIYWKIKVKNNIQFFEEIKNIYTIFRWFEKLFIDHVYEKILENHNLKLIERIIKTQEELFEWIYEEEKRYTLNVHDTIQKINEIHKIKKWRHKDYCKYFKKELNKKLLLKNKIRQFLDAIMERWKEKTIKNYNQYQQEIIDKIHYFNEIIIWIINEQKDHIKNKQQKYNLDNINMILNNSNE